MGIWKPHEYVEKFRGTAKVNVWCALSHDRVVATFFFVEQSVCADNYLDMMEQFAVPIITDGGTNNNVIFQQDGASAHYSNIVRDYLNQTFPQRWCGRGGYADHLAWPARSPDLTPLDFFLWGYVKDHVYKVKIWDLAHLKDRITEAIDKVDAPMLGHVAGLGNSFGSV